MPCNTEALQTAEWSMGTMRDYAPTVPESTAQDLGAAGVPVDGLSSWGNAINTQGNDSGPSWNWFGGFAVLGITLILLWVLAILQTVAGSTPGIGDYLTQLLAAISGQVSAYMHNIAAQYMDGAAHAFNTFSNTLAGYGESIKATASALAQVRAALFAQAQFWYLDSLNWTNRSVGNMLAIEKADFQQSLDWANAVGQSVLTVEKQDFQQALDWANTVGASVLAQVRADTGNLQNLIDQNFFTLQRQEQTDTSNLQTQIQTQVQPKIDALQSLIALTVVPAIGAATAVATATADKLKQDEDNCIDPMCKNLSKNSNATGILNDLGILAMILAFIAECVHDPKGVSDFFGATIAPLVNDTTRVVTAL